MALSPDGDPVAAADAEGRLYVWNRATGALLKNEATGHALGTSSLAFLDEHTLVSAGADRVLQVWDASRPGPPLRRVDLKPEGQTATVAFPVGLRADRKAARIYYSGAGLGYSDLSAFGGLRTLEGNSPTGKRHALQADVLALSADGTRLYTGAREAVEWDLASGREIRTLASFESAIRCLAVAPGGEALACGLKDGLLVEIDLQKGASRVLPHGSSSIRAKPVGCWYLNRESILAVFENGRVVRIRKRGDSWDSEGEWMAPVRAVSTADLSSSGRILALGETSSALDGRSGEKRLYRVVLFDVDRRTFLGTAQGLHGTGIEAVAEALAADRLASRSADGMIVWKASTGERELRVEADPHPPRAVALDPRGSKAYLSCGRSNDVVVWDLRQGKEIERIPVGGPVRGLEISRKGDLLACASWTTVEIVNLAARRIVAKFEAEGGLLGAFALSRDGRFCAFGEDRGARGRWSIGHIASGTVIYREFLDCAPSALHFDSTDFDLWIAAGLRIYKFDSKEGTLGSVPLREPVDLLASVGRNRLVMVTDSILALMDYDTGQILGRYPQHRDAIVSLAVSEDGRFLVTASKDATVCLWSVNTQ